MKHEEEVHARSSCFTFHVSRFTAVAVVSAPGYSRPPMSELSRDEFATRVITIVHERFPLVKIGPGDGGFSISVNGAVAPLENLYRVTILHPQEIKHHVERWAVELLRAAEGTPDAGATYDDVKDRILPMLVRATPAVAIGSESDEGSESTEGAESAESTDASEAEEGDDDEGPSGGVISQPLIEGL